MSYFPFRDHPDLAKLDGELVGRLIDLTGEANAVTVAGVHKDLCGCTDSGCDYLGQLQLNTTASGPELLGYLVGRGLLRLDTVSHDTLVHSVSEVIQRDEAGDLSYAQTARRIVDLLRPDLTPTGGAR